MLWDRDQIYLDGRKDGKQYILNKVELVKDYIQQEIDKIDDLTLKSSVVEQTRCNTLQKCLNLLEEVIK